MRAVATCWLAMSCAPTRTAPGAIPVTTMTPSAEEPRLTLPSASPAERITPPERDVPSPAPAEPCDDPCNGELTEPLSAALQAQARSTRGCYERELRQDPQAQGKVVVSMRVGRDGRVCSATVGASELGSRLEFARCVEERLKASPLPPPGDGCLEAVIPLSFVPAPQPGGSPSAAPPASP